MPAPNIDPMTPFDNPKPIERVQILLTEDQSVTVAIKSVGKYRYAIPLHWRDTEDCFYEVSIRELLHGGQPSAHLHRWSTVVSTILRHPCREEVTHLLIPGVANLNHDPFGRPTPR